MQASTSVSALGARQSSSASSSAPAKRKTRHRSGAPPAGGTAGLKLAHYREARLPLLLLLPQLLVLLLFFFIPAIRALAQAFVITNLCGIAIQFVWFDNSRALLSSPEYHSSIWTTVWFTLDQNVVTIVIALA